MLAPFFDKFGVMLESCWGHAGVAFGFACNNFDIMVVSFLYRFGIVLRSFWDHFGIILGSFWDQFTVIMGSFWDNFYVQSGITLGSLGAS